jgi:hypothetical protein
MSKVVELSDEEYAALAEAAQKRHETPEQMLKNMVRALAGAGRSTVYYSVDDMFEALDAYAATIDADSSDADQ